MAFVWGAGGAQLTPEQIAERRKLAAIMMREGGDYSPIQHWTQGINRVAQGMLGGLEARDAEKAELANRASEEAMLAPYLGGGVAPVAAPSPVAAGGADPYADAIASVESGGNYAALGPITRTGDRAYGKYQVMGANVPAWTEAALGRKLTPQEFIADPAIQDAVFKHQFGSYVNKYGPEGAAKAWFAGEGGMNDLNRKDQLGTSVADYARKFTAALPNDPAALPPNATPAQYVIPGQPQPSPGVATVAGALDPTLVRVMTSPYTSDNAKRIAQLVIQQQQAGAKVSTVDLGNAVGVMDARGNIIRQIPKGEPIKGSSIEDLYTDLTTGEKVRGIWNPATRTYEPIKPPAPAAGVESKIPPAPAGVDPKIWREIQSKRAAEEGLPADPKVAAGLRDEIRSLPSYKNIAQAAPVYKSMLDAAGRDNRAADVNLIYGMAKVMDPASVVRESEMTVATAIATLPQQLRATVESQLAGTGRLSPEVRQALMQEARSRLVAYQGMFEQDAEQYKGIAQRGRVNVEDVLPKFGAFEEYKPPTAAAPAIAPDAPIAINPKTKERMILQNGKWVPFT